MEFHNTLDLDDMPQPLHYTSLDDLAPSDQSTVNDACKYTWSFAESLSSINSPMLSSQVNEKSEHNWSWQHCSTGYSTWHDPNEEQLLPCTTSQDWFNYEPYDLPTTTALFAAASVTLVPIIQYRTAHDRNGGEQSSHGNYGSYDSYSYSNEAFAVSSPSPCDTVEPNYRRNMSSLIRS